MVVLDNSKRKRELVFDSDILTLIFTYFFSRFIINVPEAEQQSPERICFQVEQAHWFYEDFVRLLQPSLPSFQLKTFSEKNILFYYYNYYYNNLIYK